MTKKFKVYHLEQDRYWEYEEVYINQEGLVLLIEDRGSFQPDIHIEDITNKVRIEWES